MANVHKIQKDAKVLKTEISLKFKDAHGKDYDARILRDEGNPEEYDVFVNGERIPKNPRQFDEYLICERDDKGNIEIGDVKYTTHVLKTASEGALLIGNGYCPFFLNPPGITINL